MRISLEIQKNDIFARVAENYKTNFDKLEERRFHFASRLFLWSGDEFSKQKLAELKAEYIGQAKSEHAEKIKSLLAENSNGKDFLFKKEREKFFAKYPLLKKYNKLLFKNIVCKTIYGLDLRTTIKKYVTMEEFLALGKSLLRDREAIAVLSTAAVNYFYALDFFLGGQESILDPNFFLEIAEDNKFYQEKDVAVLRVYLLTHCIIGESAFYARPIERHREVYEKMLVKLEEIIKENYEKISLDSKVEFLVCAQLCEHASFLKEKILGELKASFDSKGNYFIEKGKIKNEATFRTSEHRNVLALMAFHFKKTKSEKRGLAKG
ncbi:MAG: hypothetical protein WCF93_03240 [Candidatus Moraniibacteriota bacterium]